ncbi:hypothetical protein SELMODRAFT_403890 [Selaginella moellendorffii]|uniref:SGS domain-containing protein n=1 Tax=Selaginella moellendorffii TaxID=88036 RepID=D8QSW1_SELML|nr:hypothetical protein SELMODRAFT_403890 [Selaginella moellendorffii]
MVLSKGSLNEWLRIPNNHAMMKNAVLSVQNEMVDEQELQNVVKEVLKEAGIEVANFIAYGNSTAVRAHYVIFWELKRREGIKRELVEKPGKSSKVPSRVLRAKANERTLKAVLKTIEEEAGNLVAYKALLSLRMENGEELALAMEKDGEDDSQVLEMIHAAIKKALQLATLRCFSARFLRLSSSGGFLPGEADTGSRAVRGTDQGRSDFRPYLRQVRGSYGARVREEKEGKLASMQQPKLTMQDKASKGKENKSECASKWATPRAGFPGLWGGLMAPDVMDDLQELKALLDQAKRPRLKSLLSAEIASIGLGGDESSLSSRIYLGIEGVSADKVSSKFRDESWQGRTTGGFKPDEGKNSTAGIMDLTKNMYDEGDDNMKKTIAQAWTDARRTVNPA